MTNNISSDIKKPTYSAVLIGHVDAGKSTIGGSILNSLNLIDSRTLDKYKKESAEMYRESWYLSWALDTNPEERAKGKTVEICKVGISLENTNVSLIDSPGHKLYVSQMIAGANQADIAILVISAKQNEFEAGLKGGQTREHIILAKAGNIDKVVVVINKMDEINYNEEIYRSMISKLDMILAKLFSKIKYIPVSGLNSININKREKDDPMEWYKEETLLEYLNGIKIERSNKLLATIVEKNKNIYTIRIESGRINIKSDTNNTTNVKILPSNSSNVITNIYDEEDIEIEEAEGGEEVKIKMKNDEEYILGSIITNDNFLEEKMSNLSINKTDKLSVGNKFTANLNILEAKNLITAGYQCILHVRMYSTECKIIELRKEVEEGGKKKMVRIKYAKKKDRVLVKIETKDNIVLNTNDKFAIRDEDMTVAIGQVRHILE
ncbi:Elongation factor Tu GTP binding domain protein [Spraguea lophii 42_110]|uniref:Elongation factor Tu GTP binding domain protein n=1 Tax=Spraguea lophii (strain 42_110) TaxID=1358809 RepID=S7XUJ1_SPRLO|nr:Elongation factor Tu GTP binding domain protein [Spraguea lophii 42_110]